MSKDDGTQLYCPDCKEIAVCKSIPLEEVATKKSQHWYNPDHPDIRWFRRGRECTACGYYFLTAEMQESFLIELAKLRETLESVKKDKLAFERSNINLGEKLALVKDSVNRYIKETEQATRALEGLRHTLWPPRP